MKRKQPVLDDLMSAFVALRKAGVSPRAFVLKEKDFRIVAKQFPALNSDFGFKSYQIDGVEVLSEKHMHLRQDIKKIANDIGKLALNKFVVELADLRREFAL